MPSVIPESDWRQFKVVHGELLQKYCEQTLEEICAASEDCAESPHARYLKVHDLLMERRREISHIFDDYRRSTAILQLGIMRRMKLLTDEDLGLFSEPTRTRIENLGSL